MNAFAAPLSFTAMAQTSNAVKNVAPGGAAKFRMVLLQIGDLLLLLPQNEVRSVESCSQLQSLAPEMAHNKHATNMLTFAGQKWPVFCLDEQFGLLAHAPQQRRACVLLQLAENFFGLLCDDARVLNAFDEKVHALPSAMQMQRTPITGLLRFENKLACVSNVNLLAALLHFSHEQRNPS